MCSVIKLAQFPIGQFVRIPRVERIVYRVRTGVAVGIPLNATVAKKRDNADAGSRGHLRYAYLTVTRTGVKFRTGFGMNPMETSDGIAVPVSQVADGYVRRALADVPVRDLPAQQPARQALRVPMVELERDDRMRRLDRKVRSVGLWMEKEMRDIRTT